MFRRENVGVDERARRLPVKTGLPEHVSFPSIIEVTCENEQEVRKPVGVSDGGGVYRLLIGDFGHVPLGPAHDGARVMQMGCRMGGARKNEAVGWREAGI